MTARNLKIRITVGPEDTRQSRRTSEAPKPVEHSNSATLTKSSASSKPANKLPRWLVPSLMIGALLGGVLLWYLLPDSEEASTTPVARVDNTPIPAPGRATPPSAEQPSPAQRQTEGQRSDAAATPRSDLTNSGGAVGAPEAAAAITTTAPASRVDIPVRPHPANASESTTAGAIGATGGTEQTATPPVTATPPSPSASTRESLPTGDKVARATFTTAISRLEPSENLDGVLSSARGLTRLYFFTELRGLQGQRIRHRWIINGQRIADIPINVGSERYRASSNLRLTENRKGNWEVQVLDAQGNVLHASRLEYH